MNPAAWPRSAFALTTLLLVLGSEQSALSQIAQNDIVVGLSTSSDKFRHYDSSSDSWSIGPGWSPAFMRGIEFDNSGGISHNAAGNMLASDWGGGFSGFELHNLATDGSGNSEVMWNIAIASGGTKGVNPMGSAVNIRGGGVSISPDNRYLAWASDDSPALDGSGGGAIFVHDYSPGGIPGSGTGASISGPRHTGQGDGSGNAGSLSALAVGSTQGTAWLNNTTVIAFNGFGELITLDVSGHAGGTEDNTLAGWAPTVMTNWVVANDEAAFDGDYTDVEYNPLVDPDHIYASVAKEGSSEAELFAYNYDPISGAITLARRMVLPAASNGQLQQPREIGFDSDGNLYFSGEAGNSSDNLVMILPNATNIDAWNPSDVEVFYNEPGVFSRFNGLDVALSLPMNSDALVGDYNDNGVVDAADYVIWRDHLGSDFRLPNEDATLGSVTHEDYDVWKSNFGNSKALSTGTGRIASAHVPEPATFAQVILSIGIAAVGARRRHEKSESVQAPV